MKRICMFGMILMVLFAVGCSKKGEPVDPGEAPASQEEVAAENGEVVGEEPETGGAKAETEAWIAFEALVEEGAKADELGLFIRERIGEASPEEAEAMVEALCLRQEALIHRMHILIWEPEYMEALNGAMGGVLDPEKIGLIGDEAARRDFQALSDGFLTIVRYEETPAVETDWAALSGLKERFGEDFAEMTVLYDKIQNYRYDRRNPDFKAIYADAVRTEDLIFANETSFLTWQLNQLYDRQAGALLVGPEGSYIGAFVEKAGEPYESLLASAEVYPCAKLSGLVARLEAADLEDFQAFMSIYNSYKVFGLGSGFSLSENRPDDGQALAGLQYLEAPGQPDLERDVNEALNEQALRLSGAMACEEEPSHGSYILYGNDHYLSLILSTNCVREDGFRDYREKYFVFDLKTGKAMTIADFLDMPGEEALKTLETLTGNSFESLPDFSLDDKGVSLTWETSEGAFPDYAYIPMGDLMPYVDPRQWYK